MDRILAMSLVGAAPGNTFGPGLCAGAMEIFARGGSKPGGGGAGRGGKGAAERRSDAAAAVEGGSGQREGSGADVNPLFDPELVRMYCCFDAIAPH
ncbi:hypothetical protein ACP70R_041769 [Stipagrostis hirtigluma subsp. patula]